MENKNEAALWCATDKQTGEPKLTKDQKKYWTGTLTLDGKKYPVTMFHKPQGEKKNPKEPDFKLLVSEFKPSTESQF